MGKRDTSINGAEKMLTAIPGVGRKTSNVVRSNLFNYPAIAVVLFYWYHHQLYRLVL